MKNSADLGGCYPPRPSTSVDNTLLDLQNSSSPTQPHSIIAYYRITILSYILSAVMENKLAHYKVISLSKTVKRKTPTVKQIKTVAETEAT